MSSLYINVKICSKMESKNLMPKLYLNLIGYKTKNIEI